MEFRILGPLEVLSGGRRLDLGGHKQRCVLAVLLLEANRAVPVDRLVDLLWDGDPPAQAVGTLRAYISNLRRVLDPSRSLLVTEPSGYVLRVSRDQTDTGRFEALVERARAATDSEADDDARALLTEALDLWRGPALADFADEPFAWTEAARLNECRLQATEDLMEASLACGRDAALTADLEKLVAAHPLRERLRGQLMRALYRSGRQADALRTYDDGRRVLRDELGIDPSPELRELQQAILVQAPALNAGIPRPRLLVTADRPGVVGRERELASGRDSLERALSGRGGVLLMAGEAGIGKTRLAQALADEASAGGAAVVWGAAHEGGGAPPFWPWVQVVRRLLDEIEDDRMRQALGRDAGVIAQLAPEAGELPGVNAPVTPSGDPEHARFRLYDAVTRFLQRLAEERPLAIVLDDLHWVDVPSLQLASFLAAHIDGSPILLIGTYRDGEVPLVPALSTTLASLARQPHVTRIELAGLDENEVGRLMEQATSAPAPDGVVGRVHARTNGNPFFVVELARAWVESGSLDDVPATVRDIVSHHLGRLSAASRQALFVGAALGREFGVDVVAEVVGSPSDVVLDLLDEAAGLAMIAEAAGLGRYRFAHDLTRAAVYEGMNRTRRVQLHGAIAAALERRYRTGQLDLVSEVAHHFLQASSAGLVAQAIRYAEAAADAASARLAYEEAERQLNIALDLVPGIRSEADAARLELDLRSKLGSLLFMTRGYSDPGVLPALTRALDLCRTAGSDRERMSILWATWGYAMGKPDLPAARKLADELLNEARQTGDRSWLIVGYSASGMTSLHEGDLVEARDQLDPAAPFAGATADRIDTIILETDPNDVLVVKHPGVSGRALLAPTLLLLGDQERAFETIERAQVLARRLQQPFNMALVQVVECSVYAIAGDPGPVQMLAEQGLALAGEHGFRQWELIFHAFAGWCESQLGDAGAGARRTAAALEGLAASGSGMLEHFLRVLEAQAWRRARRLDDAMAAVERGIRVAEISGERFLEAELHRLRGELLWEIDPGRPEKARASLDLARDVARRQRAVLLERRADASLGQRVGMVR